MHFKNHWSTKNRGYRCTKQRAHSPCRKRLPRGKGEHVVFVGRRMHTDVWVAQSKGPKEASCPSNMYPSSSRVIDTSVVHTGSQLQITFPSFPCNCVGSCDQPWPMACEGRLHCSSQGTVSFLLAGRHVWRHSVFFKSYLSHCSLPLVTAMNLGC